MVILEVWWLCVILIVWSMFVCLCSYLAQILNETLRLAIVGPFAARVQDTDSVIAGYHIPAGVCLCFCQLQYVCLRAATYLKKFSQLIETVQWLINQLIFHLLKSTAAAGDVC